MNKGSEILTFFITLCLCVSCGVQKHLASETVNVRDSVVVHVKDSMVIRYDTVVVELPIESHSAILVSSDSSHLETSLATSDAWLDSIGLHHTLENKFVTLTKEVPVQEHIHSEVTEQQHRKVETITIIQEVEKDLSWWQKLWITSGQVLWGILAGLVIFAVVKLKLKL